MSSEQIYRFYSADFGTQIKDFGPNQVHMARFGMILCQNRSHSIYDASGMPPGLQNPLKVQKSRDSGKSRKIREFPYIPYSCGVATTWPITLVTIVIRSNDWCQLVRHLHDGWLVTAKVPHTKRKVTGLHRTGSIEPYRPTKGNRGK